MGELVTGLHTRPVVGTLLRQVVGQVLVTKVFVTVAEAKELVELRLHFIWQLNFIILFLANRRRMNVEPNPGAKVQANAMAAGAKFRSKKECFQFLVTDC